MYIESIEQRMKKVSEVFFNNRGKRMKKVSEVLLTWITLSLTLTLLEGGRVIAQGGSHTLTALFTLWGLLWIMSGVITLFVILFKRTTERSWPKLITLESDERYTLIVLLLVDFAALVYITQWSVEWSSHRFRTPLYRGLFAGFTATSWAVLSLISIPSVWRLIGRQILPLRKTLTVQFSHLSKVILMVSFFVCFFASQVIIETIFPSLKTVDLRLPALILSSFWSIAYLPTLFAQSDGLLISTKAKSKLLAALLMSIVASLIYGSQITPTQALRIDRDTSLARIAISSLEKLSDSDGDGSGDLWGGGDCDDSNPRVRPGIPDRYRRGDSNCNQVVHGKDKLVETIIFQSPQAQSALPNEARLKPKNLILLTIDALRYDAYQKAMPETRRFAHRALDFTNAYAAGAATYWSIPALLGSRPPSFFKMGRDQTPVNTERLLTESLRDAHFHTALFANVTIFFVRGLSQGAHTKNYDTSHHTIHGAKPGAAHLTDGLIKHIDRWRSGQLKPKRDRFMLWAHYYDPHDPYFEIGNLSGGSDHQRYLNIVRSVDKQLNRLFKALEERQLLNDTMIVLTADHGDEFGDHGHRFHGKTLYEEMVKVPLIIYSPAYQGRKVNEVFSHLDVAPTILSHLGLPSEKRFMGHDWDQELRARESLEESQALFEVLPDRNYGRHLVGIRKGTSKLIAHVDRGALESYELDADPLEANNLPLDSKTIPLYKTLMSYVERQLRQLSRGEARVKLPK